MSEVYQFATLLKIIYKNDKVIGGISAGEGTSGRITLLHGWEWR